MSFRRGFPTRGFPARGFPAGWAQGTAVANAWWPSRLAPGEPYMRLFATDADGSIEELDIVEEGIHGLKLSIVANQPRRLELSISAPQHTRPIPQWARVWLIDESYGYWGTPVFEGYAEEITPASTLEIRYVCYDGLKRAAHEGTVMSVPWVAGPSGVPTTGAGAVPSLIFNVKQDSDEDAAHSRDNDATLSTMVENTLDDAAVFLRSVMAAPVDGSDTAYVAADLADLILVPQSKVIFQNETLPNAINHILQLDPRHRYILQPGDNDRHWRIFNCQTATQVTLTLNESGPSDNQVLSMNLQRSFDRRYGAVEIYGPRKAILATFKVSDGTLTETWNGTEESNFQSFGPEYDSDSPAAKIWQVTDAARRNLASKMPSEALVPAPDSFGVSFFRTRELTLIASYDSGTTWEVVKGAKVNLTTGTITAPNPVYQYVDGGSPPYQLPDDVWFFAAYYDTPITVRYPASGYSGTAYTETGRGATMRLQDMGLAIGFENGVPVAEAARTAQFQELCQRLQEAYCDVAYAGGCVLGDINYDWINLAKRVNFDGVDGDGGALTTGWENINAVLTEVEYDYSEQSTTLVLNGDQMEFMGVDVEQLKTQLKIDAKQWRVDTGPMVTLDFGGGSSSFFVGGSSNPNSMGNSPTVDNSRKSGGGG